MLCENEMALFKLVRSCQGVKQNTDMVSRRRNSVVGLAFAVGCILTAAYAHLRSDFYAETCPDVENIVRSAVEMKYRETTTTAPATIRLLFHDCFVQGCDASVMLVSSINNKTERDHPINLSLAGIGFDTVITAKAAVDSIPWCRNVVSCADILVMAARDCVMLAGGPSYNVELGRLDGFVSKATNVKIPRPTHNLNQLNAAFSRFGLSQTDMIAVSAAHSIGSSHCFSFANRLYNNSDGRETDPQLEENYAALLKRACPKGVYPKSEVVMDPTTPRKLDNVYFKNLLNRKGLLSSDQILYGDRRSRPTVKLFAHDSLAFNKAFVTAMAKLGRVGAITDNKKGNVRFDCTVLN